MKCDYCDNPAVVHEVTVKSGVRKEYHLCAEHAKQVGIDVAAAQPINLLLTQFVQQKAGRQEKQAATKACPTCKMTFAQFRQHSVLGCPDCYKAFEAQLAPLIERAHNGATHHVGKTPRRAGGSLDRQMQLRQIVKELDEAVAAEQYERAAKLRDRLMNLEAGAGKARKRGSGQGEPAPGNGGGSATPETPGA